MLTREQAIQLATKHELLSEEDFDNGEFGAYDQAIIEALIEASRGDLHLKVKKTKLTKQERQGFNDWKNLI